MLHDFFKYVVEKHGAPDKSAPLNSHELQSLVEVLPEHLVGLYQAYGRCILRKGLLQVCHPVDLKEILKLVLKSDLDINHENSHAFAYSPFGDIYFYNHRYGCGSIELLSGKIFNNELTSSAEISPFIDNTVFMPFSLSDESLDFTDHLGKPLFKKSTKKCGELNIGECYGFVPALGLGGEPDISNVCRLKAPEYFAIIAQLQDFYLMETLDSGQTKEVRKIGSLDSNEAT